MFFLIPNPEFPFSAKGRAGPLLELGDRLKTRQDFRFRDRLAANLHDSHSGTLQMLLHNEDALSMAHSLESRLPFMDYRLVEFCTP